MVTIVFAHPWHWNFNKAILNTVTTAFKQVKKEKISKIFLDVVGINLSAKNFTNVLGFLH